jgi:hypothetical protein
MLRPATLCTSLCGLRCKSSAGGAKSAVVLISRQLTFRQRCTSHLRSELDFSRLRPVPPFLNGSFQRCKVILNRCSKMPVYVHCAVTVRSSVRCQEHMVSAEELVTRTVLHMSSQDSWSFCYVLPLLLLLLLWCSASIGSGRAHLFGSACNSSKLYFT